MKKTAKKAELVPQGLLVTFEDGTTSLLEGETDLSNIHNLIQKLDPYRPNQQGPDLDDDESLLESLRK